MNKTRFLYVHCFVSEKEAQESEGDDCEPGAFGWLVGSSRVRDRPEAQYNPPSLSEVLQLIRKDRLLD